MSCVYPAYDDACIIATHSSIFTNSSQQTDLVIEQI